MSSLLISFSYVDNPSPSLSLPPPPTRFPPIYQDRPSLLLPVFLPSLPLSLFSSSNLSMNPNTRPHRCANQTQNANLPTTMSQSNCLFRTLRGYHGRLLGGKLIVRIEGVCLCLAMPSLLPFILFLCFALCWVSAFGFTDWDNSWWLFRL
jgi:hypothetical protein